MLIRCWPSLFQCPKSRLLRFANNPSKLWSVVCLSKSCYVAVQITLKALLHVIPQLRECLADYHNALLVSIRETFSNPCFDEVAALMSKCVGCPRVFAIFFFCIGTLPRMRLSVKVQRKCELRFVGGVSWTHARAAVLCDCRRYRPFAGRGARSILQFD